MWPSSINTTFCLLFSVQKVFCLHTEYKALSRYHIFTIILWLNIPSRMSSCAHSSHKLLNNLPTYVAILCVSQRLSVFSPAAVPGDYPQLQVEEVNFCLGGRICTDAACIYFLWQIWYVKAYWCGLDIDKIECSFMECGIFVVHRVNFQQCNY